VHNSRRVLNHPRRSANSGIDKETRSRLNKVEKVMSKELIGESKAAAPTVVLNWMADLKQ
jgi:hypothetical protein